MIYLDHAAATPVHPQALEAMLPYFSDQFFNPSSPYLAAKHVRDAYNEAKSTLAHTIGAKAPDLVITAGATESINLAFTAVVERLAEKITRVLILSTEHASVRSAAAPYHPVEIRVNRHGLIDLADLRAKLTPDTQLVSVALANNELGTIQPLAQISEIIRAERQRRLQSGNHTPLYLHSDASQALSLLDINVSRLGVDLLTINSPKVYGPKGIGALYVAHGIQLQPIVRGGGQERGLRSGTENVPGLIGFATAAKIAKDHLASNRQKYQHLTQLFRMELVEMVSKKESAHTGGVRSTAVREPLFLGHPKHQLANFCPVSFPGLDAERLIYLLEDQEIYLSTGAACAASKGEKSHVLTAIGLSDAEIAGSLRISFGVLNDEDNVRAAARAIASAALAETERMNHE